MRNRVLWFTYADLFDLFVLLITTIIDHAKDRIKSDSIDI